MANSNFYNQIDFNINYDSTNYIDRISNTPNLFNQGINTNSVNLDSINTINSIYFMGMGGSGIGGDVFIDLVKNQLKFPAQSIKACEIPNSINKKSLVFISSYSGNTDETIKMFNDSLNQNAIIIIISQGGMLTNIAKEKNIPLIKIPNTVEPRSSIMFIIGALISFFSKANLINISKKEINDCFNMTKSLVAGLKITIPTSQNLAKNIASNINNKLPIIISADYLSSTANRWKTQLNENSDIIALTDNLPEMFHNSIEGYDSSVLKQANPYFLLLTSNMYNEYNTKKFNQLKDLLKKNLIPYREIKSVGNSKLSQLFSLLILGDYISYYLAISNKIDPSNTQIITDSK